MHRRRSDESRFPSAMGGWRKLGVPTALDRFVRQAVPQVTPIFDPTLADHSYGLRPERSAKARFERGRGGPVERLSECEEHTPRTAH